MDADAVLLHDAAVGVAEGDAAAAALEHART